MIAEVQSTVLVPARTVPATYMHMALHTEDDPGTGRRMDLSVAYQGVVEKVEARVTRTFERTDGGPIRQTAVRLELVGEVEGSWETLATDLRVLSA